MQGMLFDLQRASTVDGPGFRTTVFFKGCNLRCAWCHNPEGQSFARQMLFYEDRCAHCGACKCACPRHMEACALCGACTRVCPQEARAICGQVYTAEAVMDTIRRDRLFYETSGGGATFSGGECMLQPDFLEALLAACGREGIHTAVDTAGAVPFSDFERIIPLTDLFLYDVKCMDPHTHLRYTGVGNGQILENLARLLRMGARVWVRVPIVPGVNDTAEEMRALRDFLTENGCPERVELLPYHRMGERKAKALGRSVRSFYVPEEEQMAALREVLRPLPSC